jgi:hypothetical protein
MIGIWATAAYACMLLAHGSDHPSDVLGVTCLVLSLCALKADNPALLLAASAASGIFWVKQLLIAPVVLLHYLRRGKTARGLLLGSLTLALGAVGWLYLWRLLGPNYPIAVLTRAEWIAALPRGLICHVGFAGPPLMAYFAFRRRLDPLVRTSLTIYPLIMAAYGAQSFYLYELRSFWAVVPVFVLLLAAWADDIMGARDCDG